MYFSRVRIKPDVRESSNLHHILSSNGYGAHQLLCDLFLGCERHSFLFREEIAGEQIPHYRGARGEPIFYIISRNLPIKSNPLFSIESKSYEPKLNSGDHLIFKLRANPIVARKGDGKDKSIRHDVVMNAQRDLLCGLAKDAGVKVAGKKSDLKKRVLDILQKSKNQEIASKLKLIMKGNERYQDFYKKRLSAEKILDLGLKAAADSALETWLKNKGKANGFTIVYDMRRKLFKFQAAGYCWHALPNKGRTAGFSSIDFDGEIEVCDPDLFNRALFEGIGPAKGFGCGMMLVRRARS